MENSPKPELAENEKQQETSLRGSGRVAKRICFISVGELEVSSVFFFCCSSGREKKGHILLAVLQECSDRECEGFVSGDILWQAGGETECSDKGFSLLKKA